MADRFVPIDTVRPAGSQFPPLVAAEVAKLVKINAPSVSPTTWDELDKPDVIAAGDTPEDARNAIDAAFSGDALSRADLAGGSIVERVLKGILWVSYLGPDGALPEVLLDTAGRVPDWVLTAQRSRLIANAPVDIIIVAGQSNAMQVYSTQIVDPAPEDVVEWSTVDHKWTAPAMLSPWLGNAAARRYAELQARPQYRRTGVVAVAAGGKGFSTTDTTWDRHKTSATRNLATEMIATAKAALAASPAGSKIAALIWSQGEADPANIYEAAFDDLVTWTRAQLSSPNLPVLIASMTPEYVAGGGEAPGVAAILEDTPRRLTYTSFVPGPTDMTAGTAAQTVETVHFHPMGHRARGRALVEQGYEMALLNRADAAPLPPQRIRVSRSGDKAVIRWDHPPTRATAYVIETCTDGTGSAWAAVSLSKPTTHTHTVTVTAGTPLWVRGKTTNEVGTSINSTEVKA